MFTGRIAVWLLISGGFLGAGIGHAQQIVGDAALGSGTIANRETYNGHKAARRRSPGTSQQPNPR
jgi:hypothetical protein